MNFPRGPPADCRRRPLAEIDIKNVFINYGTDDNFRVRVYVPLVEDAQSHISGKPALIMYHGGGWIHGYPEVDEGKKHITPFRIYKPLDTNTSGKQI